MEFLLIYGKGALLNLSHVGTLQNEVRSCNLRAVHVQCIFMYMANQTMLHSMQNCKGNIHCSQRGQPSHAAVEGEGRIVLHHQLCITKCN